MSVTAINVVAQPRLTETLTGGAQITMKLEAKCSAVTDGVLAVRAHASCPSRGDAYSFSGESDASFTCISVTIDPKADSFGREASKVYEISATYSNSVDTATVGDDEDDPLDDLPIYRFFFNREQRPNEDGVDLDGVKMVNTAGELFDPPLAIDDSRPVVTITRNEASFSPATAAEYYDTVNSTTWAGLDAGVAKMANITADPASRNGVTYYVVTYEIELRWDGWIPTRVLNRGFNHRPAVGEDGIPYKDPADGLAPSVPILLDEDGLKLPDGSDPTYVEFRVYREADFGPLNLGL